MGYVKGRQLAESKEAGFYLAGDKTVGGRVYQRREGRVIRK